jgi:hypothetical protein
MEAVMPATKTSNDSVAEMAGAIAKEIMQRREIGPEVLDLGALTGSFTLEIKYKDTTYSLKVSIPDTAGGVYVFSLSEKGTAEGHDIATFTYKDTSNWQIEVGLPAPISLGEFSIQVLTLKLGEGTVTP